MPDEKRRIFKPHYAIIFFILSILSILFLLAPCAFGQIGVVSGSGPYYPSKIDSIVFVVKVEHSNPAELDKSLFAGTIYAKRVDSSATVTKKHVDSISTSLPVAFYDEFKLNVDSVFHYVDAVRLQRPEITGCSKGIKFGSYIAFFCEKKTVVKISFACKCYSGGLLDIRSARYPFAVKFKPEFTKKMETIYLGMKKNKRPL
ncbi:MAG TPA: hypothetical protein DCO75_11560 [Fibrobacteres bacterium]|nr:hypothetical protein [Fibrobacterota bacterium]